VLTNLFRKRNEAIRIIQTQDRVVAQALGFPNGVAFLPVGLAVQLIRSQKARSVVLRRPKEDHVSRNSAAFLHDDNIPDLEQILISVEITITKLSSYIFSKQWPLAPNSPKVQKFRRVLALAKFARELPLLNFFASCVQTTKKNPKNELIPNYKIK
jgi:hypothetical protein